jgi:hypothetical protein
MSSHLPLAPPKSALDRLSHSHPIPAIRQQALAATVQKFVRYGTLIMVLR